MNLILFYIIGGLLALLVIYHIKMFINEKQFKREMNYFGRRRIAMKKLYNYHHRYQKEGKQNESNSRYPRPRNY